MISFENILRWKGYPLDKAARQIRQFHSMPREQQKQWIEEKKREVVRYHSLHNPVYRKVIHGKSITDWNSLPIMKKSDFQHPLPMMVSDEWQHRKMYTSNTSGSSGHPFFFAKDTFCHALVWAYIIRSYVHLGIDSKKKQARFYGIPLTRLSYANELLKDYFMNRKRFIVFDLGDEMLEQFFQRFQKTKFDYIYGYTNSLLLFAKYLDRKNIVLKKESSRLRLCITTSEVCTEEDRTFLSRVFGVPVVREYGASELDVIAIEDIHGRWSVNESNLFVEVLGADDQPLPFGSEGRLIITSLFNKAMPFIRYEVGDIGIIEEDEKGLVLKKLSGRVNDTILLPSGKRSPGFTFYYISRNILESGGLLKEFVIKQTALDTFEFDVVAYSPLREKEISEIKKIMDQYLEPGLKLKINQVDKIHRPASGKLKHFHSAVNQ